MFPSKCLLLFGICLRKGARIIKNISKFSENMLWNLNVCAILFNPSNEGKINASQTIYRSLKKIKQLLCDKKCAGTSTLTQVKKPTAYRSFFYANLKRGHNRSGGTWVYPNQMSNLKLNIKVSSVIQQQMGDVLMSFEFKINLEVVGYLLRVPHSLKFKQIQQQGIQH